MPNSIFFFSIAGKAINYEGQIFFRWHMNKASCQMIIGTLFISFFLMNDSGNE